MANLLYIGKLNPIMLFKEDNVVSDHYFSKFMDDYDFNDTLHDYEKDFDFTQEWIQKDIVKLQIRSNYGPAFLQLYTIDDLFVSEVAFIQKQEDFFNPGLYIRQAEFNLSLIPEGCYRFKLKVANEIIAYSNKIVVVEKPSRPSILVGYSNDTKYEGIYFGVPFSPTIRVPAILMFKEPASVDVIYRDQKYNPEILKSTNYRVFTFIVGGELGIPPYFISKLGKIFGCSNLLIDGRAFVKPLEGGGWSFEDRDNIPLKGWKHDLIEKDNSDSLMFENNIQINATSSMIAVLENKGFGTDDNTGSGYAEFIDVD